MKKENPIIITPKTKIIDLIAEYPETEQLLMEINPAFRQLGNPLLRKTVARLATLQQAALAGGMKVEELVNQLRRATGSQEIPDLSGELSDSPTSAEVPGWFDPDRVQHTLDAREMLNRGEHPVANVLASLHEISGSDLYCLVAPFYPAPLIDKASGIGFENHIVQAGPEEFRIYFHRRT
jgi:hypothetical protein